MDLSVGRLLWLRPEHLQYSANTTNGTAVGISEGHALFTFSYDVINDGNLVAAAWEDVFFMDGASVYRSARVCCGCVWVCGCVGLQVCGCVVYRSPRVCGCALYGSTSVWVCGCVGVSVFKGVRVCGCAVYGSTSMWVRPCIGQQGCAGVYGCVGVLICGSTSMWVCGVSVCKDVRVYKSTSV
jgi:hypothetical protein